MLTEKEIFTCEKELNTIHLLNVFDAKDLIFFNNVRGFIDFFTLHLQYTAVVILGGCC